MIKDGETVHAELGGQLRIQANFDLEVVHDLTDLPPEMESDESRALRAELVQRLGAVAGELIEASKVADKIGLPAFVPLPKGTVAVLAETRKESASAPEAAPARARRARKSSTTRPRFARPESANEPVVLTEVDKMVFSYAIAHPDFTLRQMKSSEELRQLLGKKNVSTFKSADLRQSRERIVAYAEQRGINAKWFTTGETQAMTYFLQLDKELAIDAGTS